ncbi:hypothetical protein [Trichothermofontia sp.]
MAYSDFRSLSAILKEFEVCYEEVDFVTPLPFPVSDYFRADLSLMLREGVVDNSEFAICENLIYPVLKEVWKSYRQDFILWSHQALTFDNRLNGFPEYILAKRSPLGKIVFDQPYLLLVEAKQDNFEAAWAQCLAEMIAAQRLNQVVSMTVFGMTSNGMTWQFGKLATTVFSRNPTFYSLQELDHLFGAVNYLFQQCQAQLQSYALA